MDYFPEHMEVLDQTEYQELDGLSFCKKDKVYASDDIYEVVPS